MKCNPTIKAAFVVFAIFVASSTSLSHAQDLKTALTGTTITPCVGISYAGSTSSRSFENNRPDSSPVKTLVYSDGHEKVVVEDSFMRGPLAMEIKDPVFFPTGTEFRITTVKTEKSDVELTISPVSAGADNGSIKLMFGAGYSAKSVEELKEQANQMLKIGTASCSTSKPATTSATPQITLDCSSSEVVNPELQEVILDEAARTATFQKVGKPKRPQPAIFSDAQVKWNNGASGNGFESYKLSRSTGDLVVENIDNTVVRVHESMIFKCSVRTKKF